MNAEQTNQTLDQLIRAGRSIIGVVSKEEYRAMRGLDAVCHFDKQRHPKTATPRQLYHWDLFIGWQTWRDEPLPDCLKGRGGQPMTQPADALRAIIDFDEQQEAIFVLKGFEMLLNGNPVLIRGLRNASLALKARQQTAVLLSPTLTLPLGLDAEVSVVDYPLPDDSEIRSALDTVLGRKSVTATLNNGQADYDALVAALRGLELEDIMIVLHQALVKHRGEISAAAIDLVLEEKARIVKRTGALECVSSGESLASVGGLGRLKQYLREARLTFSPQAARRGVAPARGVLIAGIPGTGKSLAAKAAAAGDGRHPQPLLRMSISQLMAQGGGIVGQAQGRVQLALRVVEAIAPCVLWIDEIEKSLGGNGGEMDGGTRSDIIGDLLTWMQESTAPVFIVATANDAAALRPELVRRFDQSYFVDLPGPSARREILSLHLRKRNLWLDAAPLDELVTATRGYTGAEIEKAIVQAVRAALVTEQAGGDFLVDELDIITALEDITPIADSMQDRIEQYRCFDARPADYPDPEPGLGAVTAVESATDSVRY